MSVELIMTTVAHSARIIQDYGNRRCEYGSLYEAIIADPRRIQAWAISRGRTVDIVDKRCYAKAILALAAASVNLGFHEQPPLPAPPLVPAGPPAQPLPNPALPVPGLLPAKVRPPGVRGLAGPAGVRHRGLELVRIGDIQPQATLWTWIRRTQLAGVWMQYVCLVGLLVAGISILYRPERVLVVPFKLLGWSQMYINYALDRVAAKVESEVINAFTSALPFPSQASGSSSSTEANPIVHVDSNQSTSFIGWLCALCVWMRQQ